MAILTYLLVATIDTCQAQTLSLHVVVLYLYNVQGSSQESIACQLTYPPLSSASLCNHLDKWHILHNIPPIYMWHHSLGLREARASA